MAAVTDHSRTLCSQTRNYQGRAAAQRFNGQSVGIIANQPKFMAGVLDINASRKACLLYTSRCV